MTDWLEEQRKALRRKVAAAERRDPRRVVSALPAGRESPVSAVQPSRPSAALVLPFTPMGSQVGQKTNVELAREAWKAALEQVAPWPADEYTYAELDAHAAAVAGFDAWWGKRDANAY